MPSRYPSERELPGALPGDVVKADQVDQFVDAPAGDAVRLRERQEVVVGRTAGGIDRASSRTPTSRSGARMSR